MCELGRVIRETRKTKGISQETLGNLVDYGRQNILNIEAGRLSPSDDVLERIAKELDLPFARLKALKVIDRLDDETKRWLLLELQQAGVELPKENH